MGRGSLSRTPFAGRRALVRLVPLALAVKALFVLSLADVFEYGEELEKGAAAKAMLDGLAVPHHQLAYHYYEGGGFVVSHLEALAFALFGESVLALKLVPLAFVALVLCAGFALARRLFGADAALWFGLLFVFGPASFQKLSTLSLGIHFEACLFVLLVLGLTARIVFEREERGRDWALLGLATGFGLFFSYQTAVVALYVLPWLLARKARRLLGAGGLLGLAGFALGAAPLALMVALVGDAVLDIHGTSLAGGAKAVGRAGRLEAFLGSLYTGRGALELVGPVVWPLAFLGSLVAGFAARGADPRAFRARFAFVAGYAALFVAVYLASNFVVGRVVHFFYLMRFAPLWIACTLLLAGAVARLRDGSAPARRLGLALGLVPLALGVAGTIGIVAAGRPGSLGANAELLARSKGYLYAEYFAKLVPHLAGDDEEKLRALLGFDEPDRGWLRASAASGVFMDPAPDGPAALERARATVQRVDPGAAEEYELGLGPLLLRAGGWDLGRALELAAQAPPGVRERLVEALGRTGAGGHPTRENLRRDLELGAASADPEAFARGAGWRLHASARFRPDRARAAIEELGGARAEALRAGYEAALRAHRL